MGRRFYVDSMLPLFPRVTFERDEKREKSNAGGSRNCGTVRGGRRRKKKKGKKRSHALVPAHERTEETIVEYEVGYKLSWGDRVGNQSTSCLSFLLPFFFDLSSLSRPSFFLIPRSFLSLSCSFALSLVFFISNFTRRQPVIGWAHCTAGKKFGEFRFAVTNSPLVRMEEPNGSDATGSAFRAK